MTLCGWAAAVLARRVVSLGLLAAAVVLTVGTLALRQPLPTTLDEVRAASGDALLCPLVLGKGARFALISRFAGSTTVVAMVVTSPAATKSERSFPHGVPDRPGRAPVGRGEEPVVGHPGVQGPVVCLERFGRTTE